MKPRSGPRTEHLLICEYLFSQTASDRFTDFVTIIANSKQKMAEHNVKKRNEKEENERARYLDRGWVCHICDRYRPFIRSGNIWCCHGQECNVEGPHRQECHLVSYEDDGKCQVCTDVVALSPDQRELVPYIVGDVHGSYGLWGWLCSDESCLLHHVDHDSAKFCNNCGNRDPPDEGKGWNYTAKMEEEEHVEEG
jgi:hypothetical protein